MARAPIAVRITRNFERNLADTEAFLLENGASNAYRELLRELGDTVIANLERYPRIGRPLLEQPAYCVEAEQRMRALAAKTAGSELREYICGDYLILYLPSVSAVHLLSIRHQRQLSFDLEARWLSP